MGRKVLITAKDESGARLWARVSVLNQSGRIYTAETTASRPARFTQTGPVTVTVKKKGYADTFIERNKLIYLKRKSGATYNELVKIFKLSRIRLSVIIRRERIKDGNEIFISKEDSKV